MILCLFLHVVYREDVTMMCVWHSTREDDTTTAAAGGYEKGILIWMVMMMMCYQ